jgi:predicted HicB family RNase H-like nuclease
MTTYSGQTMIRMPAGLHAALAAEAEAQGVSLNALMVTLLAGSIGWSGAPKDNRKTKR